MFRCIISLRRIPHSTQQIADQGGAGYFSVCADIHSILLIQFIEQMHCFIGFIAGLALPVTSIFFCAPVQQFQNISAYRAFGLFCIPKAFQEPQCLCSCLKMQFFQLYSFHNFLRRFKFIGRSPRPFQYSTSILKNQDPHPNISECIAEKHGCI